MARVSVGGALLLPGTLPAPTQAALNLRHPKTKPMSKKSEEIMNYLLMTIILLLSLVTVLYFLSTHLIPNAAWRCVLSASITEAVSQRVGMSAALTLTPDHTPGSAERPSPFSSSPRL